MEHGLFAHNYSNRHTKALANKEKKSKHKHTCSQKHAYNIVEMDEMTTCKQHARSDINNPL